MSETLHEENLRKGALLAWGEELPLAPEEIARLQALAPELQDKAVEARGYVFVGELLNHYHCAACDTSWSDAWCCACDDECPRCQRSISPEESEVIGVEIIKLRSEPCSVCGSTHGF